MNRRHAYWRKSTYSAGNANCVECASSAWFKSTYSTAQGQECAEMADLGHGAVLRDSRNPSLGHLAFPAAEWAAFLAAVRADRL